MGWVAFFVSVVVHLFLFNYRGGFVERLISSHKNRAPVFISVDSVSPEKQITNTGLNSTTNPREQPLEHVDAGAPNISELTVEQIVKQGNQLPKYPKEAVDHGWQGTVFLKLSLDSDGKVLQTEILKSSGFFILDMAAKEASLKWKFDGFSFPPVLVAPVNFTVDS